MDDSDFLRRPLLRAPLSAWADRIQQLQVKLERDDDQLKTFILFHSRVSNLLEYDRFGVADKPAILDQSVDMALFQIRQSGNRHFKVPAVAIDLESHWSEEKRDLFKKAALPYVVVSAVEHGAEPPELEEIARRWLTPSAGNRYLAKRLDRSEFANILHLTQLLRPLGLIYLPQQGLTDILDIPDSHREKIRLRIQEHRRLYSDAPSLRFEELTTVDGVIATPPPACIPVAVLEFDGEVHRSDSNADLQKKQFKDELKNGIMEKAHLPLVRFSHGPDIGKESEQLGWRALEKFVRKTRELMQNDAYQAYAMHQMVLSEVRAISGDQGTNIEGLLNDFVAVLQDKAHDLERRTQELLENSSEPEDLSWMFIDYEGEFWGSQLHDMEMSPSIHSFYSRSFKLASTDDRIGWFVKCEYTKRKFDIESVDNALSDKPASLDLVSDDYVPLRVFGSDYAKELLRQQCEITLMPAIERLEQEKFAELVMGFFKTLDAASTERTRLDNIGKIRSRTDPKRVEDYIRQRVGLNNSTDILTYPDDDGTEAYELEQSRLLRNRDSWIRLLRQAEREDFDSEEVDLLYDEITKQIENRLAALRFYSTGQTARELLLGRAKRLLGKERTKPKRSATWKLGEKPKHPK